MISEPDAGFGRVYLRPLERADSELLLRWRLDNQLASLLVGEKAKFNKRQISDWIDSAKRDSSQFRFAICMSADSKHIGNAYLTGYHPLKSEAELGIFIAEADFQGHGLGREACRSLLDFGFRRLGLERIFSNQLLTNKRSIRMHQYLGFRQLGTSHKDTGNGRTKDLNHMVISFADYVRAE